jgi:predicted tellurium resistance membrane protein TerC
MEHLAENAIAFVALTAMEIVLGIDNIVFITILAGRLPPDQQARARQLGLGAALVMRILLLLTLTWILSLEEPFFHWAQIGIPESWLPEEARGVSVRDVILIGGGLFLLAKAVHEIHVKIEGGGPQRVVKHATMTSVLIQIALLDIVFSLDSVITAVAMARDISVMIAAVIVAVAVMLIFAGRISHWIEKHPTLKMLALSFLILIGVMLLADGLGTKIPKGYVYFAMAFSLGVEALNITVRAKSEKKHHVVGPGGP